MTRTLEIGFARAAKAADGLQVLRNLGRSAILADYPSLAAYVARGEARPAFGRALEALRAGQTGEPPAGWPY